MHILALTTRGAAPFQSPREAHSFCSVLRDLSTIASSYQGGDGRVWAVSKALHERTIGVGVYLGYYTSTLHQILVDWSSKIRLQINGHFDLD